MRTFNLHNITTGLTLALCMLISVPSMAEPQRRDGGRRTEQRNNSSSRPSSNNRNNNNTRPNNGKANNKPNGNDKKQRPGYNNGQRPGQHKPSATRPNQGQHKPQPPKHVATPPARPHRPNYRPMPQVKPPHNWRPYSGAPVIRGILGLTFGTLYNTTLNYLYSQNYVVDGYTDNIVYLRNVMQYNYNWDDVILNYNYGRLASAQFVDSGSYYDTSRYNNVYRTLISTYGSPISIRTTDGGGYESIWYGGDSKGMVTLEYYHHAGRYYTTLSFGTN